MDGNTILAFVLLACVVAYVFVKHKTLDNFQFVLIVFILGALLAFVVMSRHSKIEGFSDIDPKLWADKVVGLPNKVKEIIIPELDYIVDGMQGGFAANDEDMVDLEDSLFAGDADLAGDAEKLGQLRVEYASIDELFAMLREKNPSLYKKVIGEKSLGDKGASTNKNKNDTEQQSNDTADGNDNDNKPLTDEEKKILESAKSMSGGG